MCVLTGRPEGFIVGRPDLDETVRRLKAFADAGADCLYAPGITTREDIAAVVQAVAPKPVNVLIGGADRLHRATISPRSACGASASAARSRAPPGAASCAPRARSPTEGKFDGFADIVPSRRAQRASSATTVKKRQS